MMTKTLQHQNISILFLHSDYSYILTEDVIRAVLYHLFILKKPSFIGL